jgi:hypothetical protein
VTCAPEAFDLPYLGVRSVEFAEREMKLRDQPPGVKLPALTPALVGVGQHLLRDLKGLLVFAGTTELHGQRLAHVGRRRPGCPCSG